MARPPRRGARASACSSRTSNDLIALTLPWRAFSVNRSSRSCSESVSELGAGRSRTPTSSNCRTSRERVKPRSAASASSCANSLSVSRTAPQPQRFGPDAGLAPKPRCGLSLQRPSVWSRGERSNGASPSPVARSQRRPPPLSGVQPAPVPRRRLKRLSRNASLPCASVALCPAHLPGGLGRRTIRSEPDAGYWAGDVERSDRPQATPGAGPV